MTRPEELSFRHPRSGEWAHDLRDPLAEAKRAFVEPAADLCLARVGAEWRILEVGFGRGLNTATALQHLAEIGFDGSVAALGLEPFPEWTQPWPACPRELAAFAPWWGTIPGEWGVVERPAWRGEVRTDPAPDGLPAAWGAHWIFVDLFSPGAHPEDWPLALGPALGATAAPGAVLTSYCCARHFRDLLEAAGWRVERLRRPGLRDSLRAIWPEPAFDRAADTA